MEMPTRGYSMPFSTNKREALAEFAVMAVLLTMLVILYNLKAIDDGMGAQLRRMLRIVYIVLMFPIAVLYLVRLMAEIHFVPQGIAVTLWGRTIRRFPVSRIRLISAVQYAIKGKLYEKIAVCAYDQKELTALYKKKTPKLFQNSREIWFGEWAGVVLLRGAQKLRAEFNMEKNILWRDGDGERLEMLLRMYPNAQWLDCTQKKIFDERMNQR